MEFKMTLKLPSGSYEDCFTYKLKCGACGKEYRELNRSAEKAERMVQAVLEKGVKCPACGSLAWKKYCVFKREQE